jgi:hypothetical protein
MAIQGVVSISDGSRLTVSDLIGNPMWIPSKLAELMRNQFISETLLRNAGGNANGVVAYRQSNPMFLTADVQDVAEFGEIPVSSGALGTPMTAFANKRALGVRVSKEMRDENNIDAVNTQMTQLQQTFIRANDRTAHALFASVAVPTIAVADAWDTSTGKPRFDIATGIQTVTVAAPTTAQGGSADEYFGFIPDTIVLHPGLLPVLLDNDDFTKVFVGNIANENIAYTGAFPGNIFGLNILQSRTWPIDQALILQRGVVGFYSDTRPLQFTGLYPEGNGPNGGPSETWRSDATIKRAIALDQPTAAVWLTGLTTP